MARLSKRSKDILNYRPNIEYIEPDLDTTPDLRPIGDPNADQPKDYKLQRKQLRNLASSVNTLAKVVQARIDQRAKNFVVDLDPKVDAATVAAMRRQFPNTDPNRITYDQYREAKQNLYNRGKTVGDRALVTPNDIDKASPDTIGGFNITKGEQDASLADTDAEIRGALGSIDPRGVDASGTARAGGVITDSTEPDTFKSPARAESGGLRPELDRRREIVEPLDVDKFQNALLRILVNFMWRIFIRPTLPKIPFAKKWPKRICKLPKGYTEDLLNIPGVIILGEDLPTQKIPKIPTSLKDIT